MRVWVDLTNSPHVLVMRPLIEAMRADGHEVEVTARDFAQTLGLLDRFGIAHTPIGHHRGGRLAAKGLGLASRSLALARWAMRRRFDVALGHGSNDVTVAAKLLGIPSATTFDYEWAKVQHNVNCRLARRVVVPAAIPLERLAPYGATARKLRQYEGLKEEYYLADFTPDAAVLGEVGLEVGEVVLLLQTRIAAQLARRGAVRREALGRDRVGHDDAPREPAVDPVLDLRPLVVERRRARDPEQLRGDRHVVGAVAERGVEAAPPRPARQLERAGSEAEPLRRQPAAAVAPDRLVRDPEPLAQPERLGEVPGGDEHCRPAPLERPDHGAHDEHVGRVRQVNPDPHRARRRRPRPRAHG